jgi:AraC-like DNA-binding protein
MLDADHLTSILQDSLIDNVGAAFVLNEAGDVLLRAGSNRFEYFDPSVAADSDLYHDKETGEDIIITRIPSSVGGFSYVSAMPTSIYMGQINRMQTLTAVIIGVMLLFGLLLSMLFARKNTMPIKSLVYALQQNMLNREEQISSKNELDYIGQAVLSALAENRHVKQTMENYLPLLQSSLINQLLHGDPLHTERMLATLNASGVCMDKARFGVVVLSISAGREPDGSDDMNLAKFATSNLLREMLMQIGDVYTVNTGIEYIAVLIGSDLDNDRYMERLVDILYRASAFMQERMEVYPRFGLGSMQVAEGIHISFREARKACDFSFYNPQNNIVRYQDIKISAQIYSYPLETEMQLINSVKTGNSARMRELLRTIISENYTSLTLSLELARCLFFDIMSTAIKIMNEMSMDCQAAFDTDPVALLTSCTTIVEMEHALTSIFDTLCGIAGDKEISHNNQLKNTILEYIDKNFGNSDLCLNNIAGMLHLSPAYVSRFLKEYASINFMEYLRGKRIEKAVEYLGAGLSVNDVAAKVGYASSIVFIRNFKRLYGMTPGEMRTKLADPENQIQIYSGSK